jgi:hypothetical protein
MSIVYLFPVPESLSPVKPSKFSLDTSVKHEQRLFFSESSILNF